MPALVKLGLAWVTKPDSESKAKLKSSHGKHYSGIKRVKTSSPKCLLPLSPPPPSSQARLEWFPLACFVWGLVFSLIFRTGNLCPPRPSVKYWKDTGVAQRTRGRAAAADRQELGQQPGPSKTPRLACCCCAGCSTGHQAESVRSGFKFPRESELSAWVRCLQPCLFLPLLLSFSSVLLSLLSFPLHPSPPFSFSSSWPPSPPPCCSNVFQAGFTPYLLTPLVAQDDLELVILLSYLPGAEIIGMSHQAQFLYS